MARISVEQFRQQLEQRTMRKSACGLFFLLSVVICVALVGTSAPANALPMPAQAVPPPAKIITLDSTTRPLALGTFAAFYEDKTSAVSVETIVCPEGSARFQPSTKEQLNFGFTHSSYWVAITLRNAQPDRNTAEGWLLEVGYSPLDSIEFFFLDAQSRWQRRLYGDAMPFAARDLLHRNFLIPLDLPDSALRTFYLRVHSTSSLQIPLELFRRRDFYERNATEELWFGALYGTLFVMAVYNAFLFFGLRSAHYGWYVGYVLSALLYYLVVNGHAYQYLCGFSPWLGAYAHPFAVGCAVAGLSGFMRSFLRARRYIPRIDAIMNGLMWFGFTIAVAGSFLPYTPTVAVGAVAVALSVGFSLVGGIRCWQRGNTTARYFILALAAFVVGIVLFILKTFGLLSPNIFSSHAVELGSVTEAMLFALALADRYRALRLEKELAQQLALTTQQEANASLEWKVRERTDELEKINAELQRQMNILDEQANEIEIANATLQEKNLRLELLNKEKNDILGVVAHDLQNPLTTIVMNASMVRNYSARMGTEQALQLMERIETTSNRMHNIILKLLDSNALEAGTLRLSTATFDVVPLVQGLVNDYEKRAAAKNIALHCSADPPQCFARADALRLQEVVENLLSNALKFSPPNKNVWVSIAHSSAAAPVVHVSISDEGPGLSDEDKTKLFTKFARLTAKPTAGEHSTGLGLSIVKHIVEAMNGRVWCNSEFGNGATFIVELPAAPPLLISEPLATAQMSSNPEKSDAENSSAENSTS